MHDSNPPDWSGLSVVVPCFNAGEDLERCLDALRRHNGPGLEIVVVDDASTRGDPGAVAERHGATFVTRDINAGPAVARNAGVEAAAGDVILFIDSDVVVHEDTVRRALRTLRDDPALGACFGSYDTDPADPAFLSQFRNLYHRWVHQCGSPEASTFWTGCGAVRREAFVAVGGFSPVLSRMGMEDIDLGYRLRDAGYRIALVKDMECKHLKAWTLGGMVRTDIFHRGVPWMLLLLAREDGAPDLNIDHASRVATVAGGLLPVSALLGLFWPPLLGIAGLAALLITGLRWGFVRYAAKLRGPVFAAGTVPALWLFFLCSATAIPIALAHQLTGRGLQGRLAKPGDFPAT